MNKIVLNYIQEELGTEPKPLWTEIDEQAFEKAISDIDLRQFPNLNYEQFKDLAFEQLYQTAETEILESAFDLVDGFVEKFERGGVIRFEEGGSSPKTVMLTKAQMLEQLQKSATGTDKRKQKALAAFNSLPDNVTFKVSDNGKIDIYGLDKWQAGAGTGENFAGEKPGLLKRLFNAGENKAQY